MIHLWPQQQKLEDETIAAWNSGYKNVLAVAPTGFGKTRLFSSILRQHSGMSVAMAHRRELVGQMSMSLAECEVPHRIIAPDPIIKTIVRQHMDDLGQSFFHPNARCAAASVQTLNAQKNTLGSWANQITCWIQDEAHHVLTHNIWGQACAMFPNARGLGVTATPSRADGNGLGRHADGVFDVMLEGPTMRTLIDDGYLTDYVVYAPHVELNLTVEDISAATGDYKPNAAKRAVKESKITGNIVEHYQRIAPGKLGIVFSVDIETAEEVHNAFRAAGVNSELLHGKMDPRIRDEVVRRYRRREIHVLVTVDLVSEGFDLPTIEVVMFGRPTESISLFIQQWGRALRPIWPPGFNVGTSTREERLAAIAASPKPFAIICDHVNAVERHGVPDQPRIWSLDRRERRISTAQSDEIPLRGCVKCTRPYVRYRTSCPFCGNVPEPVARGTIEQVEGDLFLLDVNVLRKMRGEVSYIDGPAYTRNHTGIVAAGIEKNHRLRQEAQQALRMSISYWAGWFKREGLSDQEIHKRFYLQFGIDTLSAQTLGRPEAFMLADKINMHMGRIYR